MDPSHASANRKEGGEALTGGVQAAWPISMIAAQRAIPGKAEQEGMDTQARRQQTAPGYCGAGRQDSAAGTGMGSPENI